MKGLGKTKRIWSELGVRDPLWAIKAYSDKAHNRWGIQEFYETGIKDTNELILYLESLDLDIPKQNGLFPYELFDALYRLGNLGIAGLDYIEVYPIQDPKAFSSHLAAWAMIHALAGIASREKASLDHTK